MTEEGYSVYQCLTPLHILVSYFSRDALVISADGKGVTMRTEDLRSETQKLAQTSHKKLDKRLTKGEKRNSKRMATVASVWEHPLLADRLF